MMSENENLIEQAGQVIEGDLLRTMDVRGYLAFMSVSIGRVPYSALVRVAREIGLGRIYVPHLRDLKGSFSVARQTLDGMPLPTLSELEGWDGQVKQTILCKPLTRTKEYQVSIESRGQMRGRMHRESTPIMRLSYNEPENFNSTKWVDDFEASHWDDNIETPDVNDIRNCLEIEPYWTGDPLDVAITHVVFTQVLSEFTYAATSIDDVALRRQFRGILTKGLRGINFGAGQGVWFIPNDSQAEVLDTLLKSAELFREFNSRNNTQNGDEIVHYINPDTNKPFQHFANGTRLRILGYVDDERALQYLRNDIQVSISREIAQYEFRLLRIAESFNEDRIDLFNKRLDDVSVIREETISRIEQISSVVGGIDPGVETYPDIANRFEDRISAISSVNDGVTSRLRGLMNLRN